MFDIGFAELLIIAVVALVVLGPDKLPTAVRTLGLWIGRMKRTLTGIQSEISEELRLEEMRRNIAVSKEQVDQELREMSQPVADPSSTSAKESVDQAAFADTDSVAKPEKTEQATERKADKAES